MAVIFLSRAGIRRERRRKRVIVKTDRGRAAPAPVKSRQFPPWYSSV